MQQRRSSFFIIEEWHEWGFDGHRNLIKNQGSYDNVRVTVVIWRERRRERVWLGA
jgi:hypothetical protein